MENDTYLTVITWQSTELGSNQITKLWVRVIEKIAYSALHDGLDVPQNFLCLLDFQHPVLWNGLKTKPDRQTDGPTDNIQIRSNVGCNDLDHDIIDT